MAHGWLVLAGLASACTASSGGIAALRVTDFDGGCPVDGAGLPEHYNVLAALPFRRVHATAAFEGGGTDPDGNVVAIAWREPDGAIGRLQFDVTAARGYGITQQPTPHMTPVGYTEWNGSQRTFAAVSVYGDAGAGSLGIVNYQMQTPPEGVHEHGEFYAQLVFAGVGPNGEARCRMFGVHATGTHDRVDPYDPTWLTPDPSALITWPTDGLAQVPPTFAGTSAPSANLLAPDQAGPDPGGPPPALDPNSPGQLTGGGDGGGACD